MWIPIAVEQNDNVRSYEVDAKASSACGKKENESF